LYRDIFISKKQSRYKNRLHNMSKPNSNLNLSVYDKCHNKLYSKLEGLSNLDAFGFILNYPIIKEKRTRKRNYYWLQARQEYENFVVYVPEITMKLYPSTSQESDIKHLDSDYTKHIDSRNLELLKKYDYGRDYRIRNELMNRLKGYCELYLDDVKENVTLYHGERGYERFELFIHNKTRFDESYMIEQVGKFKYMRKALELKRSVIFVTLTLDPKYFKTMKDADDYLREKKNLLITRIKSKRPEKKALKFSYLSDYDQADKGIRPKYNENYFRYISTTETQTKKTFNLHYHFMMSFNPPDNSEDVNEKIWNVLRHWFISLWDSRKWGINEKHKVGDVHVELVQEMINPNNGLRYCHAKWYEHGEPHEKDYPGDLEDYLLKYFYKGFSYEDGDLTVNSNNVRLWVANARTFDGTRISTWRKKNNLPLDRGLINANNNNSKKFDLEENTELEITWHYGGRFSTYEIGGLKGLYKDENLDASVLELIYRRMSRVFDAG